MTFQLMINMHRLSDLFTWVAETKMKINAQIVILII